LSVSARKKRAKTRREVNDDDLFRREKHATVRETRCCWPALRARYALVSDVGPSVVMSAVRPVRESTMSCGSAFYCSGHILVQPAI